ncbi:MAG: Hsp20/alpha crystallin family protein [bacterium]|nr:Hsp20/alpha crystallin family protein [bacterium]
MKGKRIIAVLPASKGDEFDFIVRNYYTQRGGFNAASELFPPADLFETEEEVILVLDVGGIDPSNISLIYDNNQLQIKGSREDTSNYIHRNYHLMEIYYGPFQRSFDIPCKIEPNTIHAKYQNGILLITMRKKGYKKEKPVVIEVGE